jgi:hypothetical protein
MREYLEAVVAGKLPVNHDIMRNLQVRPSPDPCWGWADMG